MTNLIIGFILILIGIFALAAGAFPITIVLGISGLLMMIRGLLGITGTVLGGTFKLASNAMTTKICPYCKSRIPSGANICPQCRSNLEDLPEGQYSPKADPVSTQESDDWSI